MSATPFPGTFRRLAAAVPRRLAVLAALLALGLAAAPGRAGAADCAPATQRQVARIQSAYSALRSFSAAFTQKDRQADGRALEARGRVSYLKPGRMRWEYAPPNEQLLVTDGETVWLYDPLLDNVTVQPLGELTAGTPLSFLLGAGNLQSDFLCRPLTREVPGDRLAYVELVPREPIAALAFIQLGAQADTGRIAALRMVDGQGNLREVRFAELRTDVPLDAAAFTFVVTPGMEVIRKDGGQ